HDAAAGVVVVARRVGEGPAIGARADLGVRGAGEIQPGEALAVHAGGGAGGRVTQGVIGQAVAADDDAGIGLGDGKGERAADGVVVAIAAERPALAVVAGVGAGEAGGVQLAIGGDAAHGDGLRVGVSIVGAAGVAADDDACL